MPGRSSLSEVEHANSQLAATRLTSMHFLDSQSMQELLEPIQALASNCSKVSDQKLLQQSGKATLQALRAYHEAAASNFEDKSLSSRLYTAGFRALNSILASLRGQHSMSTAELVDLLRHFFTYDIELNATPSGAYTVAVQTTSAAALGARGSPNQGSIGKAAYRPPHARRRPSSGTGWSDDASTGSQSGSESDTGSDSDSSRGSRASSQARASALRLAALTCLQQLAKADCRALHPFWIVLLPVYNPLQTKYHAATLMDAIVRDPLPKVRALAAAVLSSMLEGPAQKAYLIIAEAKSAARPPVRGFTTLSSTLGHLVIALHDGLLHAISNETHVSALINMLKTLDTLMLSAAYNRLPSDLLPRCIEALSRRLHSAPQKLVATSADIQAVQPAACACLAAAFGTKSAYPPVETLLHAQATTSLISTLLNLSLTEAGPVLLRTEALSALCGLAKNYTACLISHWAMVSQAVAHNLKAGRMRSGGSSSQPGTPRSTATGSVSTPTAEAKCAQQAVRLLSEYLSGCHRLCSATGSALGPTQSGHNQHSTASPSQQPFSPPLHPSNAEASLDSKADLAFEGPHRTVQGPASCKGSAVRVSEHDVAAAQQSISSVGKQHLAPTTVSASTKISRQWSIFQPMSSEAADVVDQQRCCVMWAEACDQHFPQVGLSGLPYSLYLSLTRTQQGHIWQWMWHACQHDEAAAVRAAAVKCLGTVAEGLPVSNCRSELTRSMKVLCGALQDPALSVRVSAASAAANVADALQQQQQHLSLQMALHLSSLASAVMTACQDNDKVHVNAIRALGNLLAIQHLASAQQTPPALSPVLHDSAADRTAMHQHSVDANGSSSFGNIGRDGASNGGAQEEEQAALASGASKDDCGQWWGEAWLGDSIQCLQTSLASDTEKAQWNACYATGGLLKNLYTARLAAKQGRLHSLLSNLLMLIKDSPNYKIRSHAAGALSNLQQRDLCEGVWVRALQTVCDAAAELQGNGGVLSKSSAESGRNYQFKEGLQQQLRNCLDPLSLMATPTDTSTPAYAASRLILTDWMMSGASLQS